MSHRNSSGNKLRVLEQQAAHWVSVSKLLCQKLQAATGNKPVHITSQDIKDMDAAKGPDQIDILCRPDGQGGLHVSLTTVAEAARTMAQDNAMQHARQTPGSRRS